MCINRIYYGEEAISRIERNEEGKRNWLSKKEKKKVFKLFFAASKTTKINFSLTIKPTIGCFSAFKNFNITLSKK